MSDLSDDANLILKALSSDGSKIGNISLIKTLGLTYERYSKAKEELIETGLVSSGKGKGGSIGLKQIDETNPVNDHKEVDPNKGRKKRAIEFEEEIKTFVSNMKFDDIDGASDQFRINGVQVDVCAGHEDTLIIIECTRKDELGRKSLRDKIRELRGVEHTLESGFKKHQTYAKYEKFRYVLATKHIDVRHEDYAFANNEEPRVYIWNDNFVEYYMDLYDKINKYAKFNLLGEMGIRPIDAMTIKIPAFLVNFEKTKMYCFVMNPKDLLEVSFVARRETPHERYYQRIINKERLSKIARYIDSGEILPNNLIIALRKEGVRFNPIRRGDKFSMTEWPFPGISYGILEFPKDYRSCWIIDGQHRLYSFIQAQKTFNMPITAFEGLEIEKQCKIFLDINKNQKPVPSDLVWDLNGDMIPSEPDGIISNTVKSLNDSGPLFHKIYIPSRGIKRKYNFLKMSGMCLSLKRCGFGRKDTRSKVQNPFYNEDHEIFSKNLSRGLCEFFTCVQKTLDKDWELNNRGFVLDDGGNSIMVRLFETIIHRTVIGDKKKLSEDTYNYYLTPLKKLLEHEYAEPDKLKKLKLSITSEGGKDQLHREFIIKIREMTCDRLFGGDIQDIQGTVFRDLERDIKKLIGDVIIKEPNWLEKIPSDIKSKAIKKQKEQGEQDENKLYIQFTLGECFQILRIFENKFYPIFTADSDHGFRDKLVFEGALKHISEMRNKLTTHYTGLSKKTHDDELLTLYLKMINNCIEDYFGCSDSCEPEV